MSLHRKMSTIKKQDQKLKESALDKDIISVIRQIQVDEENQVFRASILMDQVRTNFKKIYLKH